MRRKGYIMESQGGKGRSEVALGTDIAEVNFKVEPLCNSVIFHLVKLEELYVVDNVNCLHNSYSLPSFRLTQAQLCLG